MRPGTAYVVTVYALSGMTCGGTPTECPDPTFRIAGRASVWAELFGSSGEGADAVEHAADVHVEEPVSCVGVEAIQPAAGSGGCIVDEYVGATELDDGSGAKGR